MGQHQGCHPWLKLFLHNRDFPLALLHTWPHLSTGNCWQWTKINAAIGPGHAICYVGGKVPGVSAVHNQWQQPLHQTWTNQQNDALNHANWDISLWCLGMKQPWQWHKNIPQHHHPLHWCWNILTTTPGNAEPPHTKHPAADRQHIHPGQIHCCHCQSNICQKYQPIGGKHQFVI